jgi:hypothetical protein
LKWAACTSCGQTHRYGRGRGIIGSHHFETALGLEWVDALRQVTGAGSGPELLKCDRINQGMRDVHFRDQPVEQGVCPSDHNIEGLDVVYRHVTTGCYLRLRTFKVNPDEDTELFVHTEPPEETGRDAAAPV